MAPTSPAARAVISQCEDSTAMTNDNNKPESAKGIPRIDIRSQESIRYWCDRWSVTPAELQAAVEKTGDEAPAVAFALGREAW